jgi:hypothetical protein
MSEEVKSGTHLTEFRAKEITERFAILIAQDVELEALSFAGKIERGRLANEAKAAEGDNWVKWRQDNIKMDHVALGRWMRAAAALDDPSIPKDGSEGLHALEKLYAKYTSKRVRSTREEMTRKVVEQAEAVGAAKAMFVAEQAIKAAQAPRQVTCPHCGTHFTT